MYVIFGILLFVVLFFFEMIGIVWVRVFFFVNWFKIFIYLYLFIEYIDFFFWRKELWVRIENEEGLI